MCTYNKAVVMRVKILVMIRMGKKSGIKITR